MAKTGQSGLEGLTASLPRPGSKGLPPVHLWDPPFCGDIDMRIAADGTWYYMKTPIGRPALVKLFASVLKREGGKDMVVFGGARIAHSVIRERLVDELRLVVHPVALGDGLPLWHGLPEPQRFELVSSTAYTDGSVMQVLRPA